MVEYFDYSNIFLAENTIKLSENTGINEYTIKLEEDKQLFFRLIYSLGLIKLETLKTYIKTKLVNSFIQLFKSPVRTPILFDKKSDRSFCFYVNYWNFNNLIIKN